MSHMISTQSLGEDRGLEIEFNVWPVIELITLHNETPIKTLVTKVQVSFLTDDIHLCARRVVHPKDTEAWYFGQSQYSLVLPCPKMVSSNIQDSCH